MINDATIEIRRPRWREELVEALKAETFKRREVTFLLGTDEDIPAERRAAFAPHHVEELRGALGEAGLDVTVLAVAGVGDRAGFADSSYRHAGARIVARDEIEGSVDVVHALKEPTLYEASIPGPFLRIGALHLPSYPPGVAEMLRQKNFSLIIDGATVGNCSYLLGGGDRTPIVGSMSRFAGAVAGEKVAEALAEAGKIIVVGGGIAGLAAIETVRPKLASLVVVETYPPTRERLPKALGDLGISDFEIVPALTDTILADAAGLIFAHRAGAQAAAKICSVDQLAGMRNGGALADIAIDQGGSLYFDGYDENDDAHATREKCRAELNKKGLSYYAETNIPREVPYEATERHGDASWAYVAALMGLCAVHGGPDGAGAAILSHDIRVYGENDSVGDRGLLDCLTQDLRNGVQLAVVDGNVRVTDPDIEDNVPLMQWVQSAE